jgi:hypothetical protein
MMLRILKLKQERADHQEKMAQLVSLRNPSAVAPTEKDWLEAARALNCPPENLFAVKAVESGGAAFNSEGRLMLSWEQHVFSRVSRHKYDKSHPHLSQRRWVDYRKVPPSERARHPMGMSQQDRWLLMMEAAAIDFHAATSAGAYGMWQILGENAFSLGFRDPLHMIEIMYEGHAGQLDCFIRFCKRKGCLEALQKGDWAKFERIYNGGGHGGAYAVKLAAAQSAARRSLA